MRLLACLDKDKHNVGWDYWHDKKDTYMLSDDQDVAEINRSIEYALKNISLVEAALLK